MSNEQLDMYEDVLKKLGIEGDTESDKFRSLIEYMYDYVAVNPPIQIERRVGDATSSGDRSRLDVLDLVIQSLRDHEVNLDKIATRLEKAVPGIRNGE